MQRPRASRQLLLAAVCFATSTTARSTPSFLFERQNTCVVPGFNACSGLGLPDNFCCPPTTNCIVLAKNTTLLCCPQGNNCAEIQPIICDITAQNATLHPDNSLKTTALSAAMGKCGTGCCPFGYSCNSANDCVMNSKQDTSPIPPTDSPPTSPTPSSTQPSSPRPTSSTTPSTSPNTTLTPITALCAKFPASAVLAGFFPGLLLGILLTIAGVCLLGAYRRKKSRRQSSSSFGNISEPQPISDTRTDFLRKAPQTPSTLVGGTPTRKPTVQRVKSLFQKSVNANNESPPTKPVPLMVKKQPQRPVTPVLQREPSYEHINIFADGDTASALRERQRHNNDENTGNSGLGLAPPPNLGDGAGRGSHQTTFTDMMERSGLAGLQKGQPYVYKGKSSSPGYGSPESRV